MSGSTVAYVMFAVEGYIWHDVVFAFTATSPLSDRPVLLSHLRIHSDLLSHPPKDMIKPQIGPLYTSASTPFTFMATYICICRYGPLTNTEVCYIVSMLTTAPVK